jgi:hypothetical protein
MEAYRPKRSDPTETHVGLWVISQTYWFFEISCTYRLFQISWTYRFFQTKMSIDFTFRKYNSVENNCDEPKMI